MECNQRYTEAIDYEAQDTSLLLRQGEIGNAKQEKESEISLSRKLILN